MGEQVIDTHVEELKKEKKRKNLPLDDTKVKIKKAKKADSGENVPEEAEKKKKFFRDKPKKDLDDVNVQKELKAAKGAEKKKLKERAEKSDKAARKAEKKSLKEATEKEKKKDKKKSKFSISLSVGDEGGEVEPLVTSSAPGVESKHFTSIIVDHFQ